MNAETPPVILIVDDEPAVRKVLRLCFETEAYTVLEAESGARMFELLESHPVDLITLDVSLGRESGIDLAREIRARSNVGIIIVSGKGDLIDTVVGLEVGADDYISKPFQLREVLARARSVLRRARLTSTAPSTANEAADEHQIFCFRDWTLCPETRTVSNQEGECPLTTAEFDLLEVLVRHPQRVLSRDQIMDALKGRDWIPSDRTIDNQVARLRKKIDRDRDAPLIKTVRGVGYLFAAAVQRNRPTGRLERKF